MFYLVLVSVFLNQENKIKKAILRNIVVFVLV